MMILPPPSPWLLVQVAVPLASLTTPRHARQQLLAHQTFRTPPPPLLPPATMTRVSSLLCRSSVNVCRLRTARLSSSTILRQPSLGLLAHGTLSTTQVASTLSITQTNVSKLGHPHVHGSLSSRRSHRDPLKRTSASSKPTSPSRSNFGRAVASCVHHHQLVSLSSSCSTTTSSVGSSIQLTAVVSRCRRVRRAMRTRVLGTTYRYVVRGHRRCPGSSWKTSQALPLASTSARCQTQRALLSSLMYTPRALSTLQLMAKAFFGRRHSMPMRVPAWACCVLKTCRTTRCSRLRVGTA